MNKKGHGRICLVICAGYTWWTKDISPIIYPGILLGSYIPDIDAEYSYFRKVFPRIAKIYDVFPKNNPVFKHRGMLTHSIYTLAIIGLLWYYTKWDVLIGIFLGVAGHHLGDFVTPRGLKNYFKT